MTALRVLLGIAELATIIVCIPVFAAAGMHHPLPRRLALLLLVLVVAHRCLMPA